MSHLVEVDIYLPCSDLTVPCIRNLLCNNVDAISFQCACHFLLDAGRNAYSRKDLADMVPRYSRAVVSAFLSNVITEECCDQAHALDYLAQSCG